MTQGLIEAQVSAGCMLFMHSACAAQLKSDTADCILYMQLAASKKHSPFIAPSAWNDTWLSAFTRFGWALNTHEASSCPAVDLGPGSVWAWLKNRLPAFMSSELLFEAESIAWRSFSRHPEQPALELLAGQALEPVPVTSSESHNGQRVLLQFGFLGADSVLSVALVTLTHRVPLKKDFLFEPLQPVNIVGNVELRFYSLRLMDLVYSPLREKVSQALDERRATLVCPLTRTDR